jgi:Alpha/beta hydrolase of unknown function (DUF900)
MCKRNVVIFKQQSDYTMQHSCFALECFPKMPTLPPTPRRPLLLVTIAAFILVNPPRALMSEEHSLSSDDAMVVAPCGQGDRFWCINTRSITSDARCADLENPQLSVYRLNNRCSTAISFDKFMAETSAGRQVVFYIHGNRMEQENAVQHALKIYRHTLSCREPRPIDWVVWSWPADQEGHVVKDVRTKAARTDAQGLYLSWVLRQHAERSVPITLIGYSFGGRVITGALHALAGGKLANRSLPGASLTGLRIDAGLVAPAIENDWLAECGYHQRANENLDQLLVLYNRRDAVLKRYWLIDRVRGSMALGYSGPRVFAPREDGSTISVRSRDCSVAVGRQHAELDYYTSECGGGSEMAALINDIDITH